MTTRDFELIAGVIASLNPAVPRLRHYVADRFADALAGTNPRFDRQRFLAAALGTETNLPPADGPLYLAPDDRSDLDAP